MSNFDRDLSNAMDELGNEILSSYIMAVSRYEGYLMALCVKYTCFAQEIDYNKVDPFEWRYLQTLGREVSEAYAEWQLKRGQ